MDTAAFPSSQAENINNLLCHLAAAKSENVNHPLISQAPAGTGKDFLTNPLKRNFEASSCSHDAGDHDESVVEKGAKRSPATEVKAQVLEDDNLDDDEEWVTVVGFSKKYIKLVLRKFGKYGEILDHVRIPGANWMHILYQNRSDAQEALTQSWMQINEKLLVAVKPVDPIQRKALNEPTQPVADRIKQALEESLCLLHRCEADFFILEANGDVYNIRLSTPPSCNCPDRTIPCKHILFVFLRVLEVSPSNPCVRRKTLRPCQLNRLLNTPTSLQTLAGSRVRERFLHLFSTKSYLGPPPKSELGECIKCRKEMYAEDKVLECDVCEDVGHEKCMIYRKIAYGPPFCASCGNRWHEDYEKEYLNLASYISEHGMD